MEITAKTIFEGLIEFPRINERFDGLPYRNLYLAEVGGEPTRALYKIDTETKKIKKWSEEGCCSGEPVFVAAPHAIAEDEGVVLAVVLNDRKQTSFLLVLDGKSFKEIGRARVTHAIPAGLHGQYFQ